MAIESTERVNVLYLNKTAEIGGAEISLLSLLRGLDKRRFRPTVLLSSKGPLFRRLQDENIEVGVFPFCGFRKGIWWTMPYLRSVNHIKSTIRKGKFHLVHINTAGPTQYGIIAAKLAKVPVICHRRYINYGYHFYAETCFLADAFIANSKAVEASYLKHLRPSQRSTVIYNGVDPGHYVDQPERGAELRRRYGISPFSFVIGVVGRICKAKGHDIFLKSLKEICRARQDFHVLIVGDTAIDGSEDFAADLRQFVSRNGLCEKVTFTGFIEDVFPVYSAIDLLVLPSRAEPFGRVLIEAMAMTKPVVATRAGGACEVVEEGVTGRLVPPDNSSEMAKAVLSIMKNRRLAVKMGIEGRKRVKALFSIDRNVESTHQFYLEALRACQEMKGAWCTRDAWHENAPKPL